jgi:hypothetical protein
MRVRTVATDCPNVMLSSIFVARKLRDVSAT